MALLHNSVEDKKMLLLLIVSTFSYNEIIDNESKILNDFAKKQDAEKELKWALDFISKDEANSYQNKINYFSKRLPEIDTNKRLFFIKQTWDLSNEKGYISEMEAISILRLARDWGVDRLLLNEVKKK